MISVLSVVKGRYDITQRSFDSIWNNCYDENNIEHLIMFDEADTGMSEFLKEYAFESNKKQRRVSFNSINFRNNTQYRFRNMHRDYWNKLAQKSRGHIIIGLCNDMLLNTKNYDIIIERAVMQAMQTYGHEYFQILFDDDFEKDHEYSPCIALTRPCLEVFQGIAPQEISSQGADIYVHSCFKSTDLPSIINLKHMIKIKEYCVQNGTYPVDIVQTERPAKDETRPEWKYYYDILYQKKHYYHKLNSRILQSVLKKG